MSTVVTPGEQRTWLAAHGARTLEQRRHSLRALLSALDLHDEALMDALEDDLGKAPIEAYTSEIHLVRQELTHALKSLKSWMKPQRCKVPMMAWPGSARVEREACGSVLIIGPWNYPAQLLLTPLVGALAAGCTAVLKPSEHAPATAAVIERLIGEVFDPEEVCVMKGGSDLAMSLAKMPFDHIFFTGGTETGRQILAAAAPGLVPVTLELGGKCPVLVFPADGELDRMSASIDVIARRIAWGKYLNAGQTCVAPDHVWVDHRLREPLVAALARAFVEFGTGDLAKIVNRHQFDRLTGYLAMGRVAHGGGHDVDALRLEPAILTDLPDDAPAMTEEIFGPILPVIGCASLDEALARVRKSPPPLAIYAFTRDRRLQDRIVAATCSGGVCFNDTILQITGPDLPFGGVGASGTGRYRGRATFDTFTRERSIMSRSLWPEISFRYPPPRVSVQSLKKWLKKLG
ncbi:aldehyde dehydrogenase family protein [Luteolibacter flavescens]|uniref:Aldehyde dehydrogenase n=1 Tax=Luteolibacter flavescens TaxID=1859460 RepID=A0ABT3FR17_9BACT|nr:aldehyde dehydrogenase family protein [Luteolibacter flavescens]MCW1886010.1 aldehyde dehydrogenase family protein [Luteolibacter flavescens]